MMPLPLGRHEQAALMPGKAPKFVAGGSAGPEIAFVLGRSSLGRILIARGDRGVCAILLGDEPKDMIAELGAHFATDRLVEGESSLDAPLAAVVEASEEPWRKLNFPIDVRGTPFQRRVWDELRDIPPGTTTSYAEIAKRIGAPKALRAVAGACAANVLALAIPCHRVVRSNGSLSGYRWGLERKRLLIAREKGH
jgi:AraC family transcriptional regulator of adaptative response/methylated-DNA-[protein]-cysteine methyltransferase